MQQPINKGFTPLEIRRQRRLTVAYGNLSLTGFTPLEIRRQRRLTVAYGNLSLTGFTILEFLVYITILAIVITAIGGVALNVFQVSSRTDAIQEVTHNGRFAMQKMGQDIRSASAVIFPEIEGNSLMLEFEEAEKNPTIFDVFDKTLRIKEGNKEYVDITASKVNVDRIWFKKVSLAGLDSVKIEMNISFNNPEGLPEYEFDNFFTGAFTERK